VATEPSPDPFAPWRELVTMLEKAVNETANPVLKSGEFSLAANRLISGAVAAKKLAQDLTQRYFEALNVPSRNDILALTDRLQALDDRMIGIQSTLDQIAAPARRASLPPPPTRTRKPPASVSEAIPASIPARARKSKRS
jgi:hypothetical protein